MLPFLTRHINISEIKTQNAHAGQNNATYCPMGSRSPNTGRPRPQKSLPTKHIEQKELRVRPDGLPQQRRKNLTTTDEEKTSLETQHLTDGYSVLEKPGDTAETNAASESTKPSTGAASTDAGISDYDAGYVLAFQ